MTRKYPIVSYVVMIVLGLVPTAIVTHYYGVLPNRMVIQWDLLGRMTVIGTRASTVLMIANIAAVAGFAGSLLAFWQHRALVAVDGLRAFLALNIAQIVAINLTCGMIITEALGMHLTIKPIIPPAMSVVLFAAGTLCQRADPAPGFSLGQGFGWLLMAAGVAMLLFSAIVANEVIGYYASAFGFLTMVALILPSRRF